MPAHNSRIGVGNLSIHLHENMIFLALTAWETWQKKTCYKLIKVTVKSVADGPLYGADRGVSSLRLHDKREPALSGSRGGHPAPPSKYSCKPVISSNIIARHRAYVLRRGEPLTFKNFLGFFLDFSLSLTLPLHIVEIKCKYLNFLWTR